MLLVAGVAGAEDLRTQAREKFAQGRVEFAAHNYPKALALFKESYQLAPYPDLLFNIGRCEEQLEHYREALDAYQRYLAVNPADDEVRQRAEEMRKKAVDQPPPPVEPSPLPSPEPLLVTTTTPAPRPTPVYRKWWLWTAVGGVAAVALGVGLGVGLSGADPQRTFPPLTAR